MDDETKQDYFARLDMWYADRVRQKYTPEVANDALKLALRAIIADEKVFDSLLSEGERSGLDDIVDMYRVKSFVDDNATAFTSIYGNLAGAVSLNSKYAQRALVLQEKMDCVVDGLRKIGLLRDVRDADIEKVVAGVFGSYDGFKELVGVLIDVGYEMEIEPFAKDSEPKLKDMTIEEVLEWGRSLCDSSMLKPLQYINERIFSDMFTKK